MSVSKEAEQRIIKAVSLLVRSEVLKIVAHEKGEEVRHDIRLGRFLDQEVRGKVVSAINSATDDLADLALKHLDSTEPEKPPLVTMRMSILTNDVPCSICGIVRRVAIQDIREGKTHSVECEVCAPEFKGT